MILIGSILHGYCGGYFQGVNGPSFHCKRVEFVAAEWVVARELNYEGAVVVAIVPPAKLEEFLQPSEDDDSCGLYCVR